VPSCAEGALAIVNGKAKVVRDMYCDGMGACLGHCPTGALTIVHREAEDYDEDAAMEHVSKQAPAPHAIPVHAHEGGCPGSRAQSLEPSRAATDEGGAIASRLRQWPVQLKLVPAHAPFLRDADLLVTADCVPFAYADYHRDFLDGKVLLVGCPKLDNLQEYYDKFVDMFRRNPPRTVTVLAMEVPCCGGIIQAVRRAIEVTGAPIPMETVIVGVRGDILAKEAAS
jgi:ferredoxin